GTSRPVTARRRPARCSPASAPAWTGTTPTARAGTPPASTSCFPTPPGPAIRSARCSRSCWADPGAAVPSVAMSSPARYLEEASDLANEGKLWAAADHLMAGFADLGDAADAPETDSLGRPIRGSAPKMMDKAADWL